MEVQLEGHMLQKWKKSSMSQSHSQLVSHSFPRSLSYSLFSHSVSHSITHYSVTQSLSYSVTHSLSHSVIGHTFALYSAPTAFSFFPRFDESPAKYILRQYIKWWLNHKIITWKDHPPTYQPSSLLSSSLSAPKGFRFFFLADGLWWKNANNNEWPSNAVAVYFFWQRTLLENQCMTKTTLSQSQATIPNKSSLALDLKHVSVCLGL